MDWIEIDANNPRPDRVRRVVERLRAGAIVAMPTDTTWMLACDAASRGGANRLDEVRERRLRGPQSPAGPGSPMSLVCGSLAQLGKFAILDQPQFRLVRRLLPGPYTVILPASREVPKLLQSKRRTVGVRIPDHGVVRAILDELDGPVLGATARRPDGALFESSSEIADEIGDVIDILVDSEPIWPEGSTVLDCSAGEPVLVREGRGAVEDAWR
jgi:tRNA threonylcarbamoyl adenosine modification protein (Sua5/YciO/YrdC/YwlC family)